jgi:hypothetical protein
MEKGATNLGRNTGCQLAARGARRHSAAMTARSLLVGVAVAVVAGGAIAACGTSAPAATRPKTPPTSPKTHSSRTRSSKPALTAHTVSDADGSSKHSTGSKPTSGSKTSGSKTSSGGEKAGTPIVGADASWGDPVILVTPDSMGAVHFGMDEGQAQRASGETFNAAGDGFRYNSPGPYGADYIYLGGAGVSLTSSFDCIGAAKVSGSHQVVETPQGFRLGESTSQLLAIYGKSATFVQGPPTGMEPYDYYIVNGQAGALVFRLDMPDEYVDGIMAVAPGANPEFCGG